MSKPRIDYQEILDVFAWSFDQLTRPTLHNLLAGYEEYAYRTGRNRVLKSLQAQNLIQKEGRGQDATFTITAIARQRLNGTDPQVFWRRGWNGSWCVLTFDVPEARRRERVVLWQALRARKLGLLQRSVWVWPHDLEPVLNEIMKVNAVPECFCGFESRRIFLCTDSEIVNSAWDWEEIRRQQQKYLDAPSAQLAAIKKASNLGELAACARAEMCAYERAFLFDPLLPAILLPPKYRGRAVHDHHLEFRSQLRIRFIALNTLNQMAAK
jgi:phenylacetic acid degradation operon negative regulatory protein